MQVPNKTINSHDIQKVDPLSSVNEDEFLAIGYVQDYVERRADTLIKKMGSLGQQMLNRILGSRRSQLTVITTEFKSYTIFADLSNAIVQRKDTICARIKAVRVVGLPNVSAVFLADDVLVIRSAHS